MQIILVGQPELGDTLDSHPLRQLGQRISLNYYLIPLTKQETREYIEHRLTIASHKPSVHFTPEAVSLIYKHSAGIPRLINIACDRALLTAFCNEKRRITGAIARQAIQELTTRGKPSTSLFNRLTPAWLAVAACAVLALGFTLYALGKNRGATDAAVRYSVHSAENKTDSNSWLSSFFGSFVKKDLADDANHNIKLRPVVNVETDFEKLLKGINPQLSRRSALKTALDYWLADTVIHPAKDKLEDDEAYFRLATRENGLVIHPATGDLSLIKSLNLPAILELRSPEGGNPLYLTAAKIEKDNITLMGGEKPQTVSTTELEAFWMGRAYIPWKDFLNIRKTIPIDATAEAVIALKMLLRDIGFGDLEVSPNYDEKTREAVQNIQAKYGIQTDGIVDPTTKIVLYNEMKTLNIPHLSEHLLPQRG